MRDGRTALWLHCFAGISGDMALGSLVDLGADLDEIISMLGTLPFSGWEIQSGRVMRGGISATRLRVEVHDNATVRSYADIADLVGNSGLPTGVIARSLACFQLLAGVEAALHDADQDLVHLHEVGGHDAIIDVVGTMAAVELLEIEMVYASPVAVGTGVVETAHGVLPNPVPAAVRLLEGIPSYGRPLPHELATPTGVALLRTLATAYGPMPAMKVIASGYGAGSRDFEEMPNLVQAVLGEITGAEGTGAEGIGSGQEAMLIETNVDDVTGETLAWAVTSLLDAGAYDAWISPVIAKKGRPGFVLSALCDPAKAGDIREVVRRETGTLGTRGAIVARWPSARTEKVVIVEGYPVRVKMAGFRAKAEQSDAARVASESGLALRDVISKAERLASEL
ncbi:MAG: nickel pincer cofactor biosynthesis protein LarC [Acidimicrobiales bacterium]